VVVALNETEKGWIGDVENWEGNAVCTMPQASVNLWNPKLEVNKLSI
jgi:hypothetical protein